MKNLLLGGINCLAEGKSVVWSGSGSCVGKTVSCAEILKRKFGANQITRVGYRKVEEYWEPHHTTLETLIVKREIPVIHILITQKEVDVSDPGYQSGSGYQGFWLPTTLRVSSFFPERNIARERRRGNFLKQLSEQK